MKRSVRQSLVAIALLGAVTCIVSSLALTRLIATTTAQRLERAKELVAQQLEVIRVADDAAAANGGPTTIAIPTMLGMRGGVLAPGSSADAIRPALEPPARALFDQAMSGAGGAEQPIVLHDASSDAGVVVGVRRSSRGAIVWMAHTVTTPSWIQKWRLIGITLGLAGLALVIASLHLALSVRRGAAALKASLASLGRDLDAPIARPALTELADVADGIAALAAELSRAQKEQTRLHAELAEKERLAALGRVAAGVAHEVRNPLASIKLRVDLARMESEASPAVQQELGNASTEIARLDRFVADLLTVAGRRIGPRAVTDLAALATERVEAAKPWATERGVRIAVRGAAELPVDADAIGRIVDNLVRNAVEASQPEDVVDVHVSNGGALTTIVVSDRGPGVPKGRAHELFEPFFTTKPEGTGLGLALSRAIASAHGGTLTYERKAEATRFELTLPIHRDEARA